MSNPDLTKWKMSELKIKAKEVGLKGYSKFKKDEIIEALVENGVEHVPEVKKTKKTKKVDTEEKKPSIEKLSIKLDKYIKVDNYKDELAAYDENVTDEELFKIFEEAINNFIEDDTLHGTEEYVKYISEYDKYNSYQVYLLIRKHPELKDLTKISQDKYYKTVAHALFDKDDVVKAKLYKKARMHIEKVKKLAEKEKEKAEKAASSSKGKKADKPAKKSKAKKTEDSEPEESEPEESDAETNDPTELSEESEED